MSDSGGKLGLMIAAPQSGSGKTVLSVGLMRALRERGLNLAPAKAGPDYIDPQFHSIAARRPCVNLDAWAMGPDRLLQLAYGQAGTHLLVESMMGLYDGAADGRGSAADLATALRLPILMIVDAARQSHSVAALVRGFRDHREDIVIAGVVLNRVAGARHEKLLTDAIAAIGMPVFGAIPADNSLALPSRHLGLVQAGEIEGIEAFISNAAATIGERLDLEMVVGAFAPFGRSMKGERHRLPPLGSRIAVARDAAFSFLYPHMLADWRDAGAEIGFFSPVADEMPSTDADAIFLPGGYPELHGDALAAATDFKDAMRRHGQRGTTIYGECGGYMVLGEGLTDASGKPHEMCGLLNLETSFAERRRHLGYRRLSARSDFALGRSLAAHEFHYSTVLREAGEPLFAASDAAGMDIGAVGLRKGNVMGSYMHVIDRVSA
jgi:cobyrinic acid a,c-diamide synthase